jgi:hypothetical protein
MHCNCFFRRQEEADATRALLAESEVATPWAALVAGFVGIDLTHELAPDAPTLLKFQYIDRL